MIVALIYVAVVAGVGGLIIGVALGALLERERAASRRPDEPHEALARVYEMPTPAAILAELRGPLPGCDVDDWPGPHELRSLNGTRNKGRVGR